MLVLEYHCSTWPGPVARFDVRGQNLGRRHNRGRWRRLLECHWLCYQQQNAQGRARQARIVHPRTSSRTLSGHSIRGLASLGLRLCNHAVLRWCGLLLLRARRRRKAGEQAELLLGLYGRRCWLGGPLILQPTFVLSSCAKNTTSFRIAQAASVSYIILWYAAHIRCNNFNILRL